MTVFRIQAAPYTDQLIDGHQMTRLPYPVFVTDDGSTRLAEFVQVIGFQKNLSANRIDLLWADAVGDPQAAVGMYLIVSDHDGDWFTFDTAVDEIRAMSEAETSGDGRAR